MEWGAPSTGGLTAYGDMWEGRVGSGWDGLACWDFFTKTLKIQLSTYPFRKTINLFFSQENHSRAFGFPFTLSSATLLNSAEFTRFEFFVVVLLGFFFKRK